MASSGVDIPSRYWRILDRRSNANPQDDTISPRSNDSNRTTVAKRTKDDNSPQQEDPATESDADRRRKSYFKNPFTRGKDGDGRSQPIPLLITPPPEGKTEASSKGKLPSSHPSNLASSQATEARSALFNPVAILPEINGLIKLRTASPTFVLRYLATLSSNPSDKDRQRLLETARAAVETAYSEFDRARRDGQEKMPGDAAFSRVSNIPLADVRDSKDYFLRVRLMTEELHDSTLGFAFFEAAEVDCKHGVESVSKALGGNVLGSAEGEMVEIRWAVERKCMYWAAVDMMDDLLREADPAADSGKSKGKAAKVTSEPLEVPTSLLD